jgi:hypothetical protein
MDNSLRIISNLIAILIYKLNTIQFVNMVNLIIYFLKLTVTHLPISPVNLKTQVNSTQ